MNGDEVSRNLSKTECAQCGNVVTLDERPRPITKEEAGAYFDEYRSMLVANATCRSCGALYLAWCSPPSHWRWNWNHFTPSEGDEFFDLSYRSAFNDEPDPEDLGIWRVDQFGERVGLISDPSTMSYWRTEAAEHPDASYREWVAASQQRWWLRRTAAAEVK